MNQPSALTVKQLDKSFHKFPVLKNIDLNIEPGELTVIIGRSGCGKSTLLRCLNGLEVFDSGQIVFGEVMLKRKSGQKKDREYEINARKLRMHFGIVFQNFNLFPHMTVLENLVKAPIIVKGFTRHEAEKIAFPLLDKVGLSTHKNHYPSQLSGGQQQRAAIARALALSPSVMLYDEPTSALDPWLVDEVFQVMKKLDEEGMTQIVVTHEMRFIREVSQKIVFMEEGEVVEAGVTEQMLTASSDPRTKEYLHRFA